MTGIIGSREREAGYALITTLLIAAITTALVVGFITQVMTEQKIAVNDTEYSAAFYGAEAGLEKLNSDLSKLFQVTTFPTQAQLAAIQGPSYRPAISGVSYTGYSIIGGQLSRLSSALDSTATTATVDSTAGWPSTGYLMIDGERANYTGITSTTFTGLTRGAENSTATAHIANAMVFRSKVITIAEGPSTGLTAQIIPFDLDITARGTAGTESRLTRQVQVALIPVFQFGIFSDSDLSFFAGPDFAFGGRVHSNGNLFLAEGGGTLTLSQKVTTAGEVIRQQLANGVSTSVAHSGTVKVVTTTGNPGSYRDLALNEGSVTGGPGSSANTSWPALSLTTYNGNIVSKVTGGKALKLPFVGAGAFPIDLIMQPPAGEDPAGVLGQSRLHNQASLRVLISDSVATLPGGVPLAGTIAGIPVAQADPNDPFFRKPLPTAPWDADLTSDSADLPYMNLIGGVIRIDRQDNDGTWSDVTAEILGFGIANQANAILHFQKLKPGATPNSTVATDYWPINMYDTREALFRDSSISGLRKLGVMNIVELDVNNLKRWFEGTISGTGTQARNNNGYIFYFSDRRGNRNDSGNETGEFGFENFVNAGDVAGNPDTILDIGEDLNGSGALEVYGKNSPVSPYSANADDLYSTPSLISREQAERNRVYYFRHALRIVGGVAPNLPTPGFTVTSENPVYIMGDYNANAPGNPGFTGQHSYAAVIADAVTFLSNNWATGGDDRSFRFPYAVASRPATNTYYRTAVASGKGINFPKGSAAATDFGTDGGTHNFLRYLENWGGRTASYRGSMVSLFYYRQAIGTYKCCATVYSPPATRDYTFDTDFLVPSQLPPGTPRFRDINNLSFRQTIRSDN